MKTNIVGTPKGIGTKALHIGSVVVSDCNVCKGNGYYMKIGDYDGKIKGRMKCSCNN